jgi:hypothetical protein
MWLRFNWHPGLFIFARQRVYVLLTRETGQQSYHYNQSGPFLGEVEGAVVMGWHRSRSTLVRQRRCRLWCRDGFRGTGRLPRERGECEQPGVRELRARILEERPDRDGCKARIGEAGTRVWQLTVLTGGFPSLLLRQVYT